MPEYNLLDRYRYCPCLDFNEIKVLFKKLDHPYYGLAINGGLKSDEIEKLESLGYKAWNVNKEIASYNDVDWGRRYEFATYGLITKK